MPSTLRRFGFVMLICLAPLGFLIGAADPEQLKSNPNDKIGDFTLVDLDGKTWSLHQHKKHKAIVLVFVSCECPMSNGYLPELADLHKAYADKGVVFAAINANPSEEAKDVTKHAAEYKIPFPVLRDPKQASVAVLKAEVNPQAFLIDGEFQLRYRGRIDDGYSERLKKNPKVTRRDLKEAIDEVLAGKKVSVAETKAFGCAIDIASTKVEPGKDDATYYRDALPILQNHCQSCHRPGEVAPFSLMTYAQAKKWGRDIRGFTQNKKMPPWKPADSHGQFRDERALSDAEIKTLAKWADGGMIEGDPKDAPPPRQFVEGWQLGKPDLVLEVPEEMTIGAAGRDLFRCFVLPTNLKEDQWVSAVEVKPGNPKVVHHTLNFLTTTTKARELEEEEKKREKKADEQDQGPGYSMAMGIGFLPQGGLGGWAPGQMPRHLPDGVGYLLPKESDLVIQVHYHRTGKVEKDKTRIGLYFARKPATDRFQTITLRGKFLVIPADEKNFKVEGSVWLENEATLYTVMPHMHLLGKNIRCDMTLPDGSTKTLVNIKDWEYNWQETYHFKEPIKVPAGTRFDVTAHFDNSKANPLNPNDPPKAVLFGEQTTNEMCFVFIGASAAKGGRVKVSQKEPKKE